MRKVLVGATFVLALAAAAQAQQGRRGGGGVPLTGYGNANINLSAVPTEEARRLCPASGHPRLVCLAEALLASVQPEVRARLALPYSVDAAKRWSNFPPIGYRHRVGPTLGDFPLDQLGLIKAMLLEAAGIAASEGYDELEQILNADDFLATNTGDRAGFASGNFHFAFLGQPAATGMWQLYFGGHHMAFASTYRDGQMVGATPSFRGVEPFGRFAMNGRDNDPMGQEKAAFAAMLAALSPAEQARARLDQIFTDIVVGPQRDDNFPTQRDGLRAGDLTPVQQALVLAVIETYVGDVSKSEAAAIMARYSAELHETHVAFSGTPEVNAVNDYVRIDGPSVWIEFSMQPGRSIPGAHPHSVWRDRRTDYGGNR